MRKSDLSPERRKLLVPVREHPGSFALVPPPPPRARDLIGLQGVGDTLVKAREALNTLQRLSSVLPNPDLVTRTADRREAVRSSQIEGTHSGIDDLLVFEATGSHEGLPPDVHVTKNYVYALEHGLERVRESGVAAFSCGLIKEIHARLVEHIDSVPGRPGEFRDRQNWIGGGLKIDQARFVPPPAEYLDACMDDLLDVLHYTPREEDFFEFSIIARMAVVHAQFETIHPFVDGNGRVGRILLPLMLAAEGLPPVYLAGYLKDNQREYYDALAGVQLRGKWAEWISFLSAGVEVAVQEAIDTAVGLDAIIRKWEAMVANMGLRRQSVLYRFPRLMAGTPVLTAHRAKDALNISFPSASAALAKFEELGVLVQREPQRRNRCFYAREIIELLDRPPKGAR
ncbi:Fic family protein [Geobacter sulfurreducens]|uniref:Fic family protein n=1 Tax=Geobacter sulfurreducens TaxID=35554 RepID=UPI000DBBA533|nr:Fic/DOC family N-terminal domain-containing protein [Geobacter sulfurreducens]BBA69295.1 Adenosine monophosphate-protein transferase SoFic [Geobacter sulfurreducens]